MFRHVQTWCWGYTPQIRLSADVRKCASCRSRIIETWFAGWNFGEYFSSAQEGDHCILMANPFSKSSRYKCVTFVNWDMYWNLKTLFLSIFLRHRRYIWFQSSSQSQIFESFRKNLPWKESQIHNTNILNCILIVDITINEESKE